MIILQSVMLYKTFIIKRQLLALFFIIGICFTSNAVVRTVTSLGDAGAGTLRAQILASSSGDVIVFGVRGTIQLQSPISVNQAIDIRGATSLHTVIDLANVNTGYGFVFNPGAGVEIKISGVNLKGKIGIDGALHVQSGTLVLNECLITNNVTTGAAGAMLISAGAATKITNTSFFSNGTASGLGGAVNSSGVLNLTNCTFGDNGAVFGGAIYVNSGSCNLLNCTLNNNSASTPANGHAIYGNAGNISVQNSIITDASISGLFANNGATWTSHGGNLYRGNVTGFFANVIGDNFSSTLIAGIQTSPITTGYGTRVYRLINSSPARDIGTSPGVALNILTGDARRAPRVMDGDGTAGSIIDAGAVEYTRFTVTNNSGASITGSIVFVFNDVNVVTGTTPPYYVDFDLPGSTNITLNAGPGLSFNKTVIVDGYSQNGSRVAGPANPSIAGSLTTAARPVINIDGTNIFVSGITLGANVQNVVIGGLTIRNFDNAGVAGILGSANNNNAHIFGNHFFNNNHGVSFSGSTGLRIGDSVLVGRNVMNSTVTTATGVLLTSCSNAAIFGNFSGTDTTGTTKTGSQQFGVMLTNCNNSAIGNSIRNFSGNLLSGNTTDQLYIDNASTNIKVRANLIGTNYSGNAVIASFPASARGIRTMTGSQNITVGGSLPEYANVISGNGAQQVLFSQTDNSSIAGNYIGVGIDGVTQITNNGLAIYMDVNCDNDTIGGITTGHRNIISGNNNGISLQASGNGIAILNNYIGVDKNESSLPNLSDGILVSNTNNVQIGDTLMGNVIANNNGSGIFITGSMAVNIDANFIGCTSSLVPAGNSSSGVDFNPGSPSNNCRIGFNGLFGYPNYITDNGANGINLTSGNNVSWCKNIINNNGLLGIDIQGVVGPNTNDAGDPDAGTNNLINHPVMLDAHHCPGGTTTISARYDGITGNTYRMDFYKMDPSNIDLSGYGEGEIYLGGVTFTSNGIDTVYYTWPAFFTVGFGVTAIATQLVGPTPSISSEFAQVITTNGLPSVNSSQGNATCSNTNNGFITLTVTGTTIPFYQWTDVNAGTGVGTSAATLNAGPGVYNAVLQTLAGCLITTSNFTIGANTTVEAGFTLPSSFCSNTPLTFTDTSNISGGTPTYNWVATDGTVVNNGSSQNQVFTFSPPGVYTVSLVVTVGACSDSAQIQTITIDPSPNASFSHDVGYCILLPKDTFIAVTPGGTFSGNGVNAAGIFDPFGAGANTTNLITYTVTVGSCTSQNTDTVLVYPYNPASISGLASSYCAGSPPVLVTVNPPGGSLGIDSIPVTLIAGSTYLFDPDDITNGSDGFGYLAYDVNGCPSIAAATVSLLPVPPAPTSGSVNYNVCASQGNLSIPVNASGGGTLYWYSDSTLTSLITLGPLNSSMLSGFNHIWVVENNGACNSAPLEIDVNVFDGSFISTTSPVTVCSGDVVQLNATSPLTGTWAWTGDSTISDPTIVNPTAMPAVNTTYIVTLTSNIGGSNCDMIDSIVTVIDPSANCGFQIANAFSPDGDRVNDAWIIDAVIGHAENTVTIFNRWGSRIILIENYDNRERVWEGKYNGLLVPQGTYYYTIELKDIDRQYAGWLQVTY